MSALTTPPPAGPAAATHLLRWTVDEFHRIAEMGVFEGRRPLLLRGVLLEQGTMNPPHATGVDLVSEALRAAFGAGWRTRVQLPLVLGLETDPMPDVAMVPGGPRAYATTHPTTAGLVVEVSDKTLALDTTERAEAYATGGIADYWVLDLNGRQLIVFRDPAPLPTGLGATAYRTRLALGPTDTVSPLAAPTASIPVADLLP